jgi:hypothetical protein
MERGISDHVWTIEDLLPEMASATKRTKKPTPVPNYGQELKKLSTSKQGRRRLSEIPRE